jgi:hypothetical protein
MREQTGEIAFGKSRFCRSRSSLLPSQSRLSRIGFGKGLRAPVECVMRVQFCKGLASEKSAEFRKGRPLVERRTVSVPVKIGGAFVVAVMASACSTTFDQVGSLYVAPGKFALLKCPDIAARSIADSNREKELTSLMDRANQDTAGPVINTLIYSTDLSTVRAELGELRKTAEEKNCNNPVTAAKQPTASVQRSDPNPAR